jgi:hypothetical protein
MPIAAATLLQSLAPAAPDTRLSWSRGRRPWTPGYRALARVAGDSGTLCGLNAYHPTDTDHVNIFRATGAAAAATGVAYTLASDSDLSLPTDTDITDAADFLNAICIAYPSADKRTTDGIILPRLAAGASLGTGPFFRITDATHFRVGYSYAAGPLFADVPAGWLIEVIVPTLADIQVLLDGVADGNESVQDVCDFMCAGVVGTDDGVVNLNRIFV